MCLSPESERLLGVSTALATITTVLVQGYFARRAFLVLNKSIVFAVSITLLLLFVIASGVYLSHLVYQRVWTNAIEVSAVSLYSSCVLVDVVNTAVLLWRLGELIFFFHYAILIIDHFQQNSATGQNFKSRGLLVSFLCL